MKPSPNRCYLSASERSTLQRLIDAGQITFYRLIQCEQCAADIPKGKRFCSWKCYQEAEENGEESDHGEVD